MNKVMPLCMVGLLLLGGCGRKSKKKEEEKKTTAALQYEEENNVMLADNEDFERGDLGLDKEFLSEESELAF